MADERVFLEQVGWGHYFGKDSENQWRFVNDTSETPLFRLVPEGETEGRTVTVAVKVNANDLFRLIQAIPSGIALSLEIDGA